jgi:hypothetical protein
MGKRGPKKTKDKKMFTLDKKVVEVLKSYCKRTGVPMSHVVNEAVKNYLVDQFLEEKPKG